MSDSNQSMSGLTSSEMSSSVKTDLLRNRVSQPASESNTYTSSTLTSQQRSSNQYQAPSQYQPPSSTQYQPSSTTTYQPPATTEYKTPTSAQFQSPISRDAPISREPPISTQYQPTTTQHQPTSTQYQPTSAQYQSTTTTPQYQPTTTTNTAYQPTTTTNTAYQPTITTNTQYQPTPATNTQYQSLSSQNQLSTQYQAPSSQFQTTPTAQYQQPLNQTSTYQPQSAQYQPQTPQYQAAPNSQYQSSTAQAQPTSQSGPDKPERVMPGMTRTPSVRQLQTPVDATPVMPSGKPVAKEVTITVTGKLPPVPSTQKPITDTGKEPVDLPSRQPVQDSQQRQFERPTNPAPQGQQVPRENAPLIPQKQRPTDLTLQQERPVSRSGAKTPGTWCPKTGRFIPDPPDPRAPPVPEPPPQEVVTPTPRKPKGTYCPKTGRYIPPPGAVTRKAMTPRGDEFRVKFAEIESETPRSLRKDQKTTRPSMAFGSVIGTPRDQDKAKVRRAKSTDGLAQRRAMTPRGDGRDFAKSIENYESAGEERQSTMVRSTSSRSSFRQLKAETPTRASDYRNVTPRISTFNEHYQPTGGVKKVVGAKLQWNAKSKVSSFRQPEERNTPVYEQRGLAQNETRQETKEYTTMRKAESGSNNYSEAQYNYPSNNEDDLKRVTRSRIK